jgi:hypothetical protein
MTKQELEAAQVTIKRANELLANIATCEQLTSQTLSLRKGGGEWIGEDISKNVISRGLKAWREECEKELAALKLGPPPTFPYPPLAPTCDEVRYRTIHSSDTAIIEDILK